ncbi:MAG: hypothetical protein IT260_18255 [Saprospiraceae bacterium]|nr:hypothetical protein [Saprospiraceae bacterium]
MKKSLFFCLLLTGMFRLAFAQAPNQFNFQAVAKYANDNPITGSASVRFSILDGSASGAELYQELHNNVMATDKGVIALQVGGGQVQGLKPWLNINWSTGAKYLKVEIKPVGEPDFILMGPPQQLNSVPYALAAQVSLTDKDQQTLSLSGATLSISNGNSVTLPDKDQQTLTLNNNNLSISGGNAVALPTQWWAASGTGLYNLNTGNVGIKTNNPLAPLHIKSDGVGGVGGAQLLLEENNESDGARLQFKNGFPDQFWDIWGYSNPDESLARLNLYYQNGSLGKDVISLSGTGKVGIGTNDPLAKLDVRGDAGLLGLRAETMNSDAVVGISTGDQNWAGVAGHCYAPDGNALWGQNFTNGKGGLIGGKDFAGLFWGGAVRITGISPVASANFAYFTLGPLPPPFQAPVSEVYNGNTQYSLWADNAVRGLQFQAMSDRRIKDIVGVSDSRRDLATLLQIEITDYYFKDRITKGNMPQKKVIGQQVAVVFPQAVDSNTQEFIPDILQTSRADNGWIALAGHGLQAGDIVRLFFGQKQVGLKVTEATVSGFRVDTAPSGPVFVYGRQVRDFHVVDYEAISMLNVSATQELARQVASLQQENDALRQQFLDLESRLTALNAQLNPSSSLNK